MIKFPKHSNSLRILCRFGILAKSLETGECVINWNQMALEMVADAMNWNDAQNVTGYMATLL